MSVESQVDPKLSPQDAAAKAKEALEIKQGQERKVHDPSPGSLRARMRARAEELEARTTEIFPVPLWDAVLAVELKVISWAKTEEIIEKHQRVTSQMLSTAAAEILAATVGFWEIKEEGELERIEDATTWRQIANDLAGKMISENVPDRVAVIAVASDQGAIALNALYRQWLGGANVGISDQVRRDF